MMTTEQLMQQRVIIENKWPDCPFEVGDILFKHLSQESGFGKECYYSLSDKPMNADTKIYLPGQVEPFPYLMRPLKWWEDREEKDLIGTYAKRKSDGMVTRINSPISKDGNWFVWDNLKNSVPFSEYLPATSSEYTEFVNNKNKEK